MRYMKNVIVYMGLVMYLLVYMGTFEANADLKSVIMGNYSKVTLSKSRLDC